MNDDQFKELVGSCKAARRAKKPFHFFYCEEAADEEPLLMVGKRISPADVKEVRRAAKKKKFSQGTVHSSGSGLVFQTDSAGKLQQHLTNVFAKRVPPLRKAQVVGMDADIPPPTFSAEELDSANQALDEAIIERDDSLKVEEAVSEETQQAEARYKDRLAQLQQARSDLREAFKKAQLSLADFEAAQERLPSLLEEIVNSSAKNKALQQSYDQALAAMNLTEDERRRRREEFLAQQSSLPSSEEAQRLGVKEYIQRRAEVAVSEKEVAVKAAARKVVQKKVDQATVQANQTLDALEAAIDDVPELRQLSAAAAAKEQLADQKTTAIFALQDEVTELQEQLRLLSERLKNANPPNLEEVNQLAALEIQLHTKEASLDSYTLEAEALEAEAREARKGLKERTRVLSDSQPALKQALDNQRAARDALKQVVEEEALADTALDQSEQSLADAERRLKIQQLLRDAKSLIDANQFFYDALKRVNPRDADSIQENRALIDNGGMALFERSRELYTALVQAGATPEELESLYAPVPSAWRPDALTEHMKWFKRLEEWEDAMKDAEKADKMQKEIEKKLYGENLSLVDRAQETLTEVFESTETIRTILAKVGKKKGDSEENPTATSETVEALEDTGLFDKLKEGIDVLRSNEGVVAMSEIVGLLNSGIELVGGVLDVRKAYKEKTAPQVDPTLDGLLQGNATYAQADDPLLQRMRDEKLVAAVAKLGEKGFGVFAELAGELLPGLGLAVSGKDLIKSVVEAGSRIANAILNSEILDNAQETGSTAIEALKQAKARETQLAVKASVATAVNTLKTVGEIGKVVGLAAVGAGAAAGYAISLTSSALSLANAAGNAIVDFKLASEAKRFYDLAKRGDAEGARKLFEFSRKHAKGMLAWMAKEGDKIAKQYVSVQGVTEDELAKTCPAVLQRFLLRNASEEGEQKTLSEWVTEKIETFRATLSRFASWVGGSIIDPIQRLVERIINDTMPEIPGLVAVPVDIIQALSETLADFAKKRAFLERGGKKNRKLIADLDASRRELDQQAHQQRDRVSGNLIVISGYIAKIDARLASGQGSNGSPFPSDYLDYLRDVLSFLNSTLKTNLQTMDLLADLA